MEPQFFAAMGAAVAVGISGGKLIELLWPNGKQPESSGWRSKMEALVERQLKCLEDHQKQSAEVGQMIVLMEHQMAEHEKRESEAWKEQSRVWRDMFELVRKMKGDA